MLQLHTQVSHQLHRLFWGKGSVSPANILTLGFLSSCILLSMAELQGPDNSLCYFSGLCLQQATLRDEVLWNEKLVCDGNSKKLGKFLCKWNRETETRKLNKDKKFEQLTASRWIARPYLPYPRSLESKWFIPLFPNQRIHSLNLPGLENREQRPNSYHLCQLSPRTDEVRGTNNKTPIKARTDAR